MRNQIDLLLISRRFENSIKSANTFPGADISSDHGPVICSLRIKLRKSLPKTLKKGIDISVLNNHEQRGAVKETLVTELAKINLLDKTNIIDRNKRDHSRNGGKT